MKMPRTKKQLEHMLHQASETGYQQGMHHEKQNEAERQRHYADIGKQGLIAAAKDLALANAKLTYAMSRLLEHAK